MNTVNFVEMFADDEEESAFNQECIFGNLVEGHAVYCHSKDPDAPRKCRRSWYTGGETKDKNCKFFKPNPDYNGEIYNVKLFNELKRSKAK